MIKILLRLSIAAAGLTSVSTGAMAADYEPPPPVEELRPATYDWNGPYIGALVSVVSEDGHYDKTQDCVGDPGCDPVDPEMSGTGFAGGVIAGWNYDMGGFVIGLEGDYAWGGETAQNREPAELTDLSFDAIATIRARAGAALDNTLIYGTGGVAFVNASFSGEVGPIGASFDSDDESWITGWTLGGGIEHAFASNVHGRLEYLYIGLPDEEFRLEDPNGFGGDVDMHFDGIHNIRAALTYNFIW